MSLAEKFDEFCKREEILARFTYFALVREAFYAGAEAVLPVAAYNADLAVEYQSEIDHFRSHK